MARQLRIEYPGAFYHVFSRGNQKQEIFISDEDRYYFLKLMGDAYEKLGARFHAYCLMPNHYHLFIESLSGELSRTLHLINSTFAIYLNKKHSRCGHLFQGRFKSILVEAPTYAWELSRYIHLNPVRAGIVGRAEEYEWSSYRDYIGLRKPHPWLEISFILHGSGNPTAEDLDCYARFVIDGAGHDAPSGYMKSKRTGILGSTAFKNRIKAEFLQDQVKSPDREKPQLRFYRERPDISDVFTLTERAMGPDNKFVKGLAILVCHRAAGYRLKEISDFVGMSISGISNGRRRIQQEMRANATLRSAYEEIIRGMKKGSHVPGPTKSSESNEG